MTSQIQDLVVTDITTIPESNIISFNYSRKTDVTVKLGTTTANLEQKTYLVDWEITTDNRVQLQANLFSATGTYKLLITRVTDATTPVHEFQAGSSIRATDLNNVNNQTLNIAEEVRETVNSLATGSLTTGQILIDGSNIADNTIDSQKIINLQVKNEDLDSNSVSAGKLQDNAVTTAKINNDAVTADKLANNAVVNNSVDVNAGIDGTKISPDFGSQTIRTTGNLDVPNRLQTTTNGVIFGGGTANPVNYGFNTTPSGTAASRNNTVFIAIGDNDTGILQDGDGQLEIWTNDQEIANFNATSGIFTSKNITANAPGKFIGDGSLLTSLPSAALTGALPAIDGSALLGITQSIKRVKEVSNATETNFGNNTSWHNHLTMTFNNVLSTSRFLVLAVYEIKNESSNASWYTSAKITNTGGGFMANTENRNTSTSYQQFNHWEFDIAANTTNRTYTLQVKSNNSHSGTNAFVQNAFLVGIEFTPS
tara:strand:- start:6275 stop:7720 length:1446 start_codon:yes stop_codon:yes gene_type:complete